MNTVPPGSTIGIIGAGQLGRMLGVAAAQLGYRVHVFAPASGPANDICNAFTQAAYDDRAALAEFAAQVDVVTYEFENIDADPIESIADKVPVRPSIDGLRVAQDRWAEKRFVEDLGGTPAPWRPVETLESLKTALAELGTPAILKTARFGYDGKGQVRLSSPDEADTAWSAINGQPAVLEGFVEFDHEFSVVLARGTDGASLAYPTPRNGHEQGILARSTLPAPDSVLAQADVASALAAKVAERLDYVGVLTLEFFCGRTGPIFNEMAPRVHNSGHWTIEGAETSQFENHIRAICGLPLGPVTLTGKQVEMENLIGDAATGWRELIAEPGAHLHLYGKTEIRPGRKMGHVTRVVR